MTGGSRTGPSALVTAEPDGRLRPTYLDNLEVVLIAAIIVGHALVRDRLLRLGVPFAVFALLLWPYLEYALFHRFGGLDVSYPAYLAREGTLDTGVLWFVGAALVFSLCYAGGARLARGRGAGPFRGEVLARHLTVLAVVVAVATFLVRLVLPFETDNPYVDLNMWEWPACAAMFGLGVATCRGGWLGAVPDRLRRQSRAVTLVGIGVAALFLVTMSVLGVDEDRMAGGWDWPRSCSWPARAPSPSSDRCGCWTWRSGT